MAENNFNYGDSLISAGANLMGAAIGAGVGVAQSKKQWKYQKKAMELQQKYNLQNWEMQMRCGKVAPSIVLSKTLAESLYHVMIKAWHGVTKAQIVIWVIFGYIGKLSIKCAFW